MSILQTASVQNLKRLLDLYPLSALRAQWPDAQGAKEEVCFAVASTARDNPEPVARFLDEYLGCCKQHIYVHSYAGRIAELPEAILSDSEKVFEVEEDGQTRTLYVIQFEYNVVLREPLSETTLTFLWPIRIDLTMQHLIVRFVILEKNISSYVDGPYYVSRKSTDEDTLLGAIENELEGNPNLMPVDLHKGIKTLWDTDIIDSPKARFKKAVSTSSESMDENLMIKEHAPEVYAALTESPLFNTLFQVIGKEEEFSVSTFSVDPSKGYIAFPRYSERKGDTDELIREILRNN